MICSKENRSKENTFNNLVMWLSRKVGKGNDKLTCFQRIEFYVVLCFMGPSFYVFENKKNIKTSISTKLKIELLEMKTQIKTY